MPDPKKTKMQNKLKSKKVTPEKARKDLDQLNDEQLDEVTGGVSPYPDTWPGTRKKIGE